MSNCFHRKSLFAMDFGSTSVNNCIMANLKITFAPRGSLSESVCAIHKIGIEQ